MTAIRQASRRHSKKPRQPKKDRHALNAVCPYFTMFPLEFPLRALRGGDPETVRVLDPFCGRGTTNYAARARGIESYGLDASPVAVAIARAKLAVTSKQSVLDLVDTILEEDASVRVPRGAFWRAAFHRNTLRQICLLREGLMARRSEEAVLLRAVILGCLHGPLAKNLENTGYFSNQMPRTFASKPRYSVAYWDKHRMDAPLIDVRAPIRRKLERLFPGIIQSKAVPGWVRKGDSTHASSYDGVPAGITHVVTSPPYYGLVTYVEDQWLRNWFLGGPSKIEYGSRSRLSHKSPEDFSKTLAKVWDHCGDKLTEDGKLVVRFGSIRSRDRDPRVIFEDSLEQSAHDWRIRYTRNVGTAWGGKRQADTMGAQSDPTQEFEFTVVRG